MATELKILPVPFSEVLPIEAGRFLIDTSAGPVDLYLPHKPHPGVNFKIYDATRNAATFNITIHTLCGELINGAPTLVLSGNGDMADIFREESSDNFIATTSGIIGVASNQSVFSGHYGGGLPTQTPVVGAALAYDLDQPGTMYIWNGSNWE